MQKRKKRSKKEMRTTATVIKLSLKYSLMLGGNTCVVEPNPQHNAIKEELYLMTEMIALKNFRN